MPKISLINLGCPKNLVDSEIVLGLLKKDGMELTEDIEKAEIMLLNTCAFIKDAKEESIDLIFDMVRLKKTHPNKKIAVIGCLVQRYLKEMIKELPEVDLWVTLQEIPRIPDLLKNLLNGGKKKYLSPAPSSFLYDDTMPRCMITPKHFAYIKIAEGCSNRCSYCAVPDIKGSYISRPLESILKEAHNLADLGIKELNIIAQDTTNYGKDILPKTNISELLKELCNIDKIHWIRILYTHPAHTEDSLIEEIAKQSKICKYIDLPLQHIDDDILNAMGRKIDSHSIKNLIKKIRKNIPDAVIRTSFITGFPGETEEKFNKLLKFMEEMKFERLGIFTYSREEGTPAFKLPEQVLEKTKEERYHKAMQLQNNIAKEVNKIFMDKTMEVLLEGPAEKNPSVWTGRTYADAPDVDGIVYIQPLRAGAGYINGNNFKSGDIIKVKITDTLDYDLIGKFYEPRTF